MITDERFDELIFDYLEGNLNNREREAVEILKAENETFNAQVLQWKNAYVSEPLPEVDGLQRKLLIPSNDSGISRIIYSMALLFLLVLHAGDGHHGIQEQSTAKLREANNNNKKNLAAAVTPLEVSMPAPACESPEDKSVPPPVPEETVPAFRSKISEATDFETLTYKRPLPGLGVEMPDVRHIEIKMRTDISIYLVKTGEMKKLSEKQLKVSRLHKRKRNTRGKTTFMPGNVPYVVPLNKNF